jgi:hypothetical protein
MRHVAHPQADEVAPPTLVADCQVKHGEVSSSVHILEINANSPDVFGFEWGLLPNQLPLVPGFPMRMFAGFHDWLLAVDRSQILELTAKGRYRKEC